MIQINKTKLISDKYKPKTLGEMGFEEESRLQKLKRIKKELKNIFYSLDDRMNNVIEELNIIIKNIKILNGGK